MIAHLYTSLLVLSLILLTLIGCGDDGPAPQGSLPPKVGSTWTFDWQFLDSNKRARPAESLVATVLDTDAILEGEGGFFHVQEVFADDTNSNTVYLRYEPNGDLRVLHTSLYILPFTLPVGSKVDSITLPVYDTSFVESGVTFRSHYEGVVRYVGAEEVNVGNEKVGTEHFRIDIEAVSQAWGDPSSATATVDVWYAPSVGYFTMLDIWIDEDPLFGYSLDRGQRWTLKSWSLKP